MSNVTKVTKAYLNKFNYGEDLQKVLEENGIGKAWVDGDKKADIVKRAVALHAKIKEGITTEPVKETVEEVEAEVETVEEVEIGAPEEAEVETVEEVEKVSEEVQEKILEEIKEEDAQIEAEALSKVEAEKANFKESIKDISTEVLESNLKSIKANILNGIEAQKYTLCMKREVINEVLGER